MSFALTLNETVLKITDRTGGVALVEFQDESSVFVRMEVSKPSRLRQKSTPGRRRVFRMAVELRDLSDPLQTQIYDDAYEYKQTNQLIYSESLIPDTYTMTVSSHTTHLGPPVIRAGREMMVSMQEPYSPKEYSLGVIKSFFVII